MKSKIIIGLVSLLGVQVAQAGASVCPAKSFAEVACTQVPLSSDLMESVKENNARVIDVQQLSLCSFGKKSDPGYVLVVSSQVSPEMPETLVEIAAAGYGYTYVSKDDTKSYGVSFVIDESNSALLTFVKQTDQNFSGLAAYTCTQKKLK